MNYKIIAHTVGRILQIEALLFMTPLIISIIYLETLNIIAFVISAAIAMPAGSLLSYVLGETDKLLFAKEGFAIVAIAWILISVVGAIPYVISGTIPSFVNAFLRR